MRYRSIVLGLLALAAFTVSGQAQQKKAKKDRNVITAQELAELAPNNAYDAVEHLRPDWLRRSERRVTLEANIDRGSSGAGQGGDYDMEPRFDNSTATSVKLTVFLDHTELGGVEELARMRPDDIAEMRYFSASDAQQRYGPRFSAGVILVKNKNKS